jgi:hypothetical protein
MFQRSAFVGMAALVAATALPAVAAAQKLAFTAVEPCRLIDTRTTQPLTPGEVRSFAVGGRCGVPSRTFDGGAESNRAAAVALNVVAVNATGPGHLTAWAANKPRPAASIINYSAMADTGGLNIANGVIVPLCDQVAESPCAAGDVSFVAAVNTVHLVVDVAGYFSAETLPDALRYGAGAGADSFLCLNAAQGIRYGLSRKLANYADAPLSCPPGTWLCKQTERGTGGCNTARPDGACDFIECNGACQDVDATEHRGWTAEVTASLTSGMTVDENGTKVSGGVCQYHSSWCCSRD